MKGKGKKKKGNIWVCLGFDMETDIGSWTRNYEGLRRGTPRILDLLEKLGISGTFLFTGKAALTSPETVRAVLKKGHEVGCHTLRHETIGEELFELPGLDPLPASQVRANVELATKTVEEVAGVRPVSFRAPRLFGSTELVKALEGLGYVADATYPTYYFLEHLFPYHPSKSDWTKEGKMKILELPNFADVTMKKVRDPYGRDRDQWPKFRTIGAGALLGRIDRVVRSMFERFGEAFLCFYFHPWEFVKMPTVIECPEATIRPAPFLYKNTGTKALVELRKVLESLLDRGAKFLRMKDCADIW